MTHYVFSSPPFSTAASRDSLNSPLRVRVRVRVRVTLRSAVYRQSVRLGAKPLETHDQYFFRLNTCGYSPYVTSSHQRGWVCHLKLLLNLASAVNLRSESHGTHDYTSKSQIRDSANLEGQAPYLYPPGTRWPSYTPTYLVPFSSLSAT
jgi:hypothetical protein